MIQVAKAVIWKENKYVLLIKRSTSSKFFPSLWDFPGGKAKEGEDVVKALKREVKEETSLEIVPGEEQKEQFYTEQGHTIHFRVFTVTEFTGDVKLSKDHTEYRWVHVDDLQGYELAPIVKLLSIAGAVP